ncbi:MAG: mycofactocin precursor MftA [Solirubrobacteraceae bacterium]
MTQSDTQTADAAPTAQATPAPIETATTPPTGPRSAPADHLVEDDLLVEDVSIDGMCGVY